MPDSPSTTFEVKVIHTKRRRLLVVIIPLVLSAVVVSRLGTWSSTRTRPDGTVVRDQYDSFAHKAFGYEPTSRTEERPDSTKASGALRNGMPDGTWTEVKNGKTRFIHFSGGVAR